MKRYIPEWLKSLALDLIIHLHTLLDHAWIFFYEGSAEELSMAEDTPHEYRSDRQRQHIYELDHGDPYRRELPISSPLAPRPNP